MRPMRQYLMLTFISLFSSATFAGSISYDFRFDSNSTSYNSDFKLLGYDDFSRFYVQTGRLDFKGKLNEELSYRLRWRFDKPAVSSSSITTGAPANAKRDNLNSSIDLAFVTHQLSPNLAVTFGKFASDMGGVEGQTPAIDMYSTSGAFNDNFYVDTGRGARKVAVDLYYAGAKIASTFDDQEVALHVADNREEFTNASGNNSQNKGYFAVVYKGNFMEKMFKPTASYHTVSGKDDKTKRSYTALGGKFDLQPIVLDVDYLSNEFNDANDKKDKITSAVINVAYMMDNVKPQLKFSQSTLQDNSGATEYKDNETAIGLSVEYKPFADTNFRYHAAYTDYSVKPDSLRGGDTIKRNEVILGLRMLGDFLK